MTQTKHRTTIEAIGDTQIRISRVFNAPLARVWEVYTDPAGMPEWLGPRDLVMTVHHFDHRTGGSYRYSHRDADGNDYFFFGDIREVVPQARIEQTFSFCGAPCGATKATDTPDFPPSVEVASFEDLGNGQTRVTVVSTFVDQANRDGMLQSGMERGVLDTHDRLDAILAKRQAA